MRWIGRAATWLAVEYMTDMRENRARVYDTIVKNNLHLNTVILTVSIASLTAVAALSDEAFVAYPWLSLSVITLFIGVILLTTVNFYLSGIALRDIQEKLSKDILLPFKVRNGEYTPRFIKPQRILNALVLGGFCLGLLMFLTLLSCYILGGVA